MRSKRNIWPYNIVRSGLRNAPPCLWPLAQPWAAWIAHMASQKNATPHNAHQADMGHLIKHLARLAIQLAPQFRLPHWARIVSAKPAVQNRCAHSIFLKLYAPRPQFVDRAIHGDSKGGWRYKNTRWSRPAVHKQPGAAFVHHPHAIVHGDHIGLGRQRQHMLFASNRQRSLPSLKGGCVQQGRV